MRSFQSSGHRPVDSSCSLQSASFLCLTHYELPSSSRGTAGSSSSVNDAYKFPHWHIFSYLDIWCLDFDYRCCYTPTNFVLLITPGFKYYSRKFLFICHAIINNALPESLFAPKGSDSNLPFVESFQNLSTGEMTVICVCQCLYFWYTPVHWLIICCFHSLH